MKRLAIALVAVLVAAPGQAETIAGAAMVVDGDTIRIGSERIRLLGIDAPESNQQCQGTAGAWACGESATVILGVLIDGQPVSCAWERRDQYDRALAVCVSAYGVEINRRMVEAGYALAYLSAAYLDAAMRRRKLVPRERGSGRRRPRLRPTIVGQSKRPYWPASRSPPIPSASSRATSTLPAIGYSMSPERPDTPTP